MSTDGSDLTVSATGTGSNLVTNPTRFTQDIVKDTNTTSTDGRTIMGQNTFTAINTDGTRGVLSNQGVELQNSSGVALSCLLYTSPSPRDRQKSRMPSSA